MSTETDWIPLNQAAELLYKVRELREARIELIEEMQTRRVIARARRWIEDGAPRTYKERELAVDLGDSWTRIPGDFWQRSHAWDGVKEHGYIAAGTGADWERLRFETIFEVDGGRPHHSDSWGIHRNDFGFKIWYWHRTAIGVEVDAKAVRDLLHAYSVGLTNLDESQAKRRLGHPNPGSYATADEPLIQRALAMIQTGEAKSARDAAIRLAPAAKAASIDAAVDRLGRRISARLKSASEPSDPHAEHPNPDAPTP